MTGIQSRLPAVRLPLTRVGVEGVRKLIKVYREKKRPIFLLLNIDCFVDLPSNLKGVHMSRNLEAINEILEEVTCKGGYPVEQIGERIARKVLEKHEYAERCEVLLNTKYMVRRNSQKFVTLFFYVAAARNGIEKVKIGGEVKGELGGRLARASLEIGLGDRFVNAADIIEILFQSLSSNSKEEVVSKIVRRCRELGYSCKARCLVEHADFTSFAEESYGNCL